MYFFSLSPAVPPSKIEIINRISPVELGERNDVGCRVSGGKQSKEGCRYNRRWRKSNVGKRHRSNESTRREIDDKKDAKGVREEEKELGR